MTLSLSNVDFSTVSIREERNNTEPEILSVSYDSSGITVQIRVVDEFFGRDGFYEIDTTNEDSFKLELDLSVFFSIDSLIVEKYKDLDRPLVESYDGIVSDKYTFKYVCSELDEEEVIEYIKEIWIDYHDDYRVIFEAFLNEQQKDTVEAVSFDLQKNSVTNRNQIYSTQMYNCDLERSFSKRKTKLQCYNQIF